MKTLLSLLLIFVTQSVFAQSEYLVAVRDSVTEKCGYQSPAGKWITAPQQFDYCFTDTAYNYAVVAVKSGFVAIDLTGKEMYSVFSYDNGPDYPSNGLFRIQKDSLIGFADEKTGNVVIQPQFRFAESFVHGHALVCDSCEAVKQDEYSFFRGGNWRNIDKQGKDIVLRTSQAFSTTEIKTEVQKIKNLLKKKQLKRIEYPEMSLFGGSLSGYYHQSKLVYLYAVFSGENSVMIMRYYFKNGAPLQSISTVNNKSASNKASYSCVTYYEKNIYAVETENGGKPVKKERSEQFMKESHQGLDSMLIELWSVWNKTF